MQKTFTGHRHYVQGIAWDPLGECILSQSTDRTMRVLRATATKGRRKVVQTDAAAAAAFVQAHVVYRHTVQSDACTAAQHTHSQENESAAGTQAPASQPSQPVACTPQLERSCSAVRPGAPGRSSTAAANETPVASGAPKGTGGGPTETGVAGYIFQDESLNTFFRRLAFSPEGSFVVAPAATLGPLAPTSRCACLQRTCAPCANSVRLAPPHDAGISAVVSRLIVAIVQLRVRRRALCARHAHQAGRAAADARLCHHVRGVLPQRV